MNAAAILPLTKSGSTAHNVSKFRPPTPVLAITTDSNVARRLQLVWGVIPLVIADEESTTKTFSLAMETAQNMGFLKPGDLVVQTAGTITGVSGSTDLIKVGIVRDVVARGKSSGNVSVNGKVRVINEAQDFSEVTKGDIVVLSKDINRLPEAIKYVAGIVHEADIQLDTKNDIPQIKDVNNATNILHNGDIVTLLLNEGVICKGETINITNF